MVLADRMAVVEQMSNNFRSTSNEPTRPTKVSNGCCCHIRHKSSVSSVRPRPMRMDPARKLLLDQVIHEAASVQLVVEVRSMLVVVQSWKHSMQPLLAMNMLEGDWSCPCSNTSILCATRCAL